ncbi:MAG: hypothetical protein ACJ75I_01070 [Solirubrobacterales bacterium]
MRLRRMAEPVRARPGLAAIACLGIAWGLVMHTMGWAQLAHFAQVRALADGRASIDPWHWQTKDKAWVDGHFYSVKAPGLPLLTLPEYLALDAADAWSVSRDAAQNASQADHPQWAPPGHSYPYVLQFGFDPQRAMQVEGQVEDETPMVWALTLLGAVIPAVLLLLLVRWGADRVEPGYGTAAAITLGLGTVVMTFAAEYFSHVAAAALGFAGFAILFRERQGPPRLAPVAVAGLAAGLAVTFEYPLGLLGLILLIYALARSAPRLPRTLAYGLAAVIGAAPALAFNWWALGSPFDFAYSSAVAVQGYSGHAVLGLNDPGFFGIGVPRPGAVLDLLVASRGVLTLTPVLAIAVAGAFLMRQGRWRAEANVILAVTAVFFLYNSGYWLPFGGGTPGPRFLIPALPFLALGLAVAYRRMPALTLAMAIPSAIFMLAASMTYPLLGDNGTATWARDIGGSDLEHTVLTTAGVRNGWLAALPLFAAVAAAVVFAARATPRTRLADLRLAAIAIPAWAVVSAVGPTLAGDPNTPLSHGTPALALIAGSAALSAATLLVLRARERSEERVEPLLAPSPTR